MIRKLETGTIPIPRLYICDTRYDADECRKRGVPYLIRPTNWSNDMILKGILFNTLQKIFPHINWVERFRISRYSVDMNLTIKVPSTHRDNDGECGDGTSLELTVTDDDEYRMTGGGPDATFTEAMVDDYETRSVDAFIGDISHQVDIEELQNLKLLPVFLDDIATAIKRNIEATTWMDGWNKKLDAPLGCYQGSSEAPNLIILDVSGSIPSGVAGTMVALIDSLRHNANADLIITSWSSQLFKAHEDLPSMSMLNSMVGGCNECKQFYNILRHYVLGKHWGNVIVFGDQDAPEESRFLKDKKHWLKDSELSSTRIDNILAFHTYLEKVPGYGLWAVKAAPKANVTYNIEWRKSMR